MSDESWRSLLLISSQMLLDCSEKDIFLLLFNGCFSGIIGRPCDSGIDATCINEAVTSTSESSSSSDSKNELTSQLSYEHASSSPRNLSVPLLNRYKHF